MSRCVDPALEAVDPPPDVFEALVIVRLDRGIAGGLQLLNLDLDRPLVDPNDVMMLVDLDLESLANQGEQVLLVHGAEAVQGLVVDSFGNVAELGYGHSVKLVIGVGHGSSLVSSIDFRALESWGS